MKHHASEIHTRFEGLNEPKDFDDKLEDSVFNGLLFVAKVVYLLSGIIIALLTLRFILLLLAFTGSNAFASFIYSLTQPFVLPFYRIFNDSPTYNVASIELESLVAIPFYLLIAWLVVRLISFIRD